MATGTLVRKVLLRIAADDGDTEAKLDKISAKADELGRKHPDLKVRIDTAAAGAKLAVLRKELKATDDEADKSRISIKGIGMALAGLATGADMAGFGEMSILQKALVGLNVATGIGEPLMAGLTVAVGGLSAGLVSAGAGLGVFGLVAKGVYSQVSSAVSAFQTAQNTTGKASVTAMNKYKAYMAALTPAQRAVARSIDGAENAWQGFVNKNTTGVAKIMSQGIGLLPKVFASLQPFLAPTEKALHGLIGELGKGLGSSGFKSWISSFAGASGPMLTDWGHIIGHIVVGIGGILKAFLPMAQKMTGGLDKIMAKFAKWGTTLTGHSGFQSLMSMFKSETPLAVGVLKNLAGVIKNVVSDMTGLSTFSNGRMLLEMLKPLSALLDTLSKNKALLNIVLYGLAAFDVMKKISGGITGVSNALTGMKSAGAVVQGLMTKMGLLKAVQAEAAVATEGETVAQTELDTAMDANPISLIILAVAGLVIGIVELWKHCAGFRDFWKAAWRDIKSAFDAVFTFIRDHWKLILSIITGPVGAAVVFVISHWHQIRAETGRLVSDVVGFFEQLPGRIMRALGNLGSMLFGFGKHIIGMLASGIKSAGGGILSDAMHGIGSLISDFIPHSPAKRGPLSGAGSPDLAGRRLSEMFASGILAGTPAVSRSAAALGLAGAGYGRYGGGGAGGHGPQIVLDVHPGGSGLDQLFMTWLKKEIRIRGGNAAIIGR